jgi:carbamoyl-phosphate synthase large subunit
LNIQFAIKGNNIFVLEVNPRASRTVPFVSKATGIPLAKIASKVMAGKALKSFNLPDDHLEKMGHFAVKESVLPFNKFSGVDIVLGPEMKSTGEVMGISVSHAEAFAKSQIAANSALPTKGKIFISVRDGDKRNVVPIAKKFRDLGFSIVSTPGTAKALRDAGLADVQIVYHYNQGQEEGIHLMKLIKQSEIGLIVNTPSGEGSQHDMRSIRAAAILHNVPCITTLQGAYAAATAMESKAHEKRSVRSLQEYYKSQRPSSGRAASFPSKMEMKKNDGSSSCAVS